MKKSNNILDAKKKSLLPIDIRLPERVTMEGGAVFVVLRSLDELETFWNENRDKFPYSAEGILYGDKQYYLNECEWIFAPSKAEVVKAVCRWDQIGIECKWYDWAIDSPDEYAGLLYDRDHYRKEMIEKNQWSESDEEEYRNRSPDSYRGWWTLRNLPINTHFNDWFVNSHEDIVDPKLPPIEAARLLQEQTFDDWKAAGCDEVQFNDQESLDDDIAY